jgi:hypothetical protein
MSKLYGLAFNADPRNYPSLAPTFITFKNMVTGANETPPGITQLAGSTGLYFFSYGATQPTYFLVDGITVSVANDRYLTGILDPIQEVDNQLTAASATLQAIGMSNIALGMTNVALNITGAALGTTAVALGISAVSSGITAVALGNTILALSTSNFAGNSSLLALIGNTSSSFGSEVADPSTVFGYLKRMQEFNEGDQSFNKTSGVWTIQARNTSLIATRTLSNSSSEVTRS